MVYFGCVNPSVSMIRATGRREFGRHSSITRQVEDRQGIFLLACRSPVSREDLESICFKRPEKKSLTGNLCLHDGRAQSDTRFAMDAAMRENQKRKDFLR